MIVDAKATFEELVALLSQGIGQRHLYFGSHPRVQGYARDFVKMLHDLLQRQRTDKFFLGFVEGNLVHDGNLLVGPTILGRRVGEFLSTMESGGLLFHKGVTSSEVLEVFELATEIGRSVPALAQLPAIFEERGVRHIEFSPPYEDPGWFGQFLFDGQEHVADAPLIDGTGTDMVPVYQGLFDTVQSAHSLAESNSVIEIDGVRTVSEQLVKSGGGSFTDVMQMVRYPDYDSFTVGHSVRVAMIAVLVAHRAGLPDSHLVELATAGLLHDVGKAEVPTEILYKPGRLTREEFDVIAKHPVAGAQILLENQDASLMAVGAAFGHHLRFDGGGYPAMESWGICSKMTALLKVCDVFEAMTAVRPYKSALDPRRAYEIMMRDRGAFDPGAFAALVKAMGLYPPGRTVVLSTGELGVVLAAGEEMDRPLIRLTHDSSGEAISTHDQELRDLSLTSSKGLRVVKMLEPGSAREDQEDEVELAGVGAPNVCKHDHDIQPDLGRLFGKRG